MNGLRRRRWHASIGQISASDEVLPLSDLVGISVLQGVWNPN